MAPQLYLTMYKEQFVSPGKTAREPLRPTSAHRRNNPQPRPDFLFPRSLQSSYKPHHTPPRSLTPADTGRPLFPPLGHLSFHCQATSCPGSFLDTVETNHKPNHKPSVGNTSSMPALSSNGAQTLQSTELHAGPAFQLNAALKNPTRATLRTQLPTRPKIGNPLAPRRLFGQTQYWRPSSSSILDYGGCYSCFHVVKPYQAGHYIIHPEFVSECLR